MHTWKYMDIPFLWLHILLFLPNKISESPFLQGLWQWCRLVTRWTLNLITF